MSNGWFRKLQAGVLAAILSSGAIADDAVLRAQKDPSGEREWQLTRHGVVVFNYKTRRTMAFVELPEWIWADEAYVCPPDLALGPNGEALVTSNVVPSLWRIDPESLSVTRHDLITDAHKDKDVGFTGLTYVPELGAFYAISDFGALWRIDPLLRRAQEVALDGTIPRRLLRRAGTCGFRP